jgi:hypothetical protein
VILITRNDNHCGACAKFAIASICAFGEECCVCVAGLVEFFFAVGCAGFVFLCGALGLFLALPRISGVMVLTEGVLMDGLRS